MAKPWDDAMKQAVGASPEDFVAWLMHGATFIDVIRTELPKKEEEPLRSDICLAIELEGKPGIVNIEFQSTGDPHMPERLLEYSLRITRNDPQRRPVYSYVIYLRKVRNAP